MVGAEEVHASVGRAVVDDQDFVGVIVRQRCFQGRKIAFEQLAAVVLKDRPIVYLYHRHWLWAYTGKLSGLRSVPDGLVRVYAAGAFAGVADVREGVVQARRLFAQPQRCKTDG